MLLDLSHTGSKDIAIDCGLVLLFMAAIQWQAFGVLDCSAES